MFVRVELTEEGSLAARDGSGVAVQCAGNAQATPDAFRLRLSVSTGRRRMRLLGWSSLCTEEAADCRPRIICNASLMNHYYFKLFPIRPIRLSLVTRELPITTNPLHPPPRQEAIGTPTRTGSMHSLGKGKVRHSSKHIVHYFKGMIFHFPEQGTWSS